MRRMRAAAAVLLCSISLATRALAGEPEPPRGDAPRLLDPSDPDYRTPRAGEAFRTEIFGRDVDLDARDRRSTSAFDLGGGAWIPGADQGEVLPFGSLYFWRRPEDWFLRANVGLLYNDVSWAHSLAPGNPFEVVVEFENNTVPIDNAQWADGERLQAAELRKGWVRGALGLGYRRQLKPGWRTPVFTDRVDPQKPDNMFSIALLAEPKYLYFSERNSDPRFVVPQDTFELDGKVALRWDALERNLLELAHSGYAVGFDATYGWRANWEDWGINRSERAERGRYPKLFQTYAVAATGVPGLGERHRWLQLVHAGWGWGLDRFSQPRVGGGPGGQEFGSLSRPLLPGADISEFTPNKHYAIALSEYRYELFFFTYLSARGGIAWLDRDRLTALGDTGPIHHQNDFLVPVGAGITTGFLFKTQLQLDYNYNFDVIREGERGGSEVVLHVSKSF
jgi:hypothetical protein